MMYTVLPNGNILRYDGAIIPVDTNNMDYVAYTGWLKEGNTPVVQRPPSSLSPTDNTFGDDPWQF